MITVRLGLPPLVDPEFWELPFPERMAVIAHEAGHVYHRHLWVRLFNMFAPKAAYTAMCHAQEFEADQFARSLGYGPQLAAFLKRQPCASTFKHPATKPRIANLIR